MLCHATVFHAFNRGICCYIFYIVHPHQTTKSTLPFDWSFCFPAGDIRRRRASQSGQNCLAKEEGWRTRTAARTQTQGAGTQGETSCFTYTAKLGSSPSWAHVWTISLHYIHYGWSHYCPSVLGNLGDNLHHSNWYETFFIKIEMIKYLSTKMSTSQTDVKVTDTTPRCSLPSLLAGQTILCGSWGGAAILNV